MHDMHEIMARVIAVSASPGPSAVCSFAPCAAAAAVPYFRVSAFGQRRGGREEEETDDADVDMNPIGCMVNCT